jgi:serine/threonine-protein kinase HipA
MECVGKAVSTYSTNTLLDTLYFFEVAVFSFLTGNNDMYLKNFSLIKNGSAWGLSPAYDLLNATIVNSEDDEEMALTLQGKKRKLKKEHFEQLGENLGLNKKQIDRVFSRFFRSKPIAEKWIRDSFLSEGYQSSYLELLEKRYAILNK